jgi:hypothetical protein
VHTPDVVNRIVAGVLVIAGVIHVLPSAGVVGADALNRLYGLHLGDPDVVLLLKHRAVLFGLMGIGLIVAAFRPTWQGLALAVALVSTVSFVVLWLVSPAAAPAIVRVAYIDIGVAVLLVAATALRLRYPAPRS